MQRRRHTLRTTDTPTHHAQWEAIAHDRPSHPPQTPRRTDGGRHNPTHTGAAQTPYTSALARCGRRSPLGPISPFQRRRAATRRAEPVSAGDLGAARDAGMRDGSVGSVPKADRLGCELGSHRFCTRSITCRPSEAALDGPGPAAVKASVDEGMSSREPSSSAAGAPVQLSGVRDRSRPLTNSRNVSDLVHADSRASWLTPHPEHKELAQGPAVGVAVLIELHPLHGFVVKRKRPGVGAWVTC